MVELEGSNYDFVGMVVQKFWRFVEECGIVLITFEDELFSPTQSEAAAEVFSNSADEKIGIATGVMQNPGKHRSRSRLPMRSCNNQRVMIRQEKFFDYLRKRAI